MSQSRFARLRVVLTSLGFGVITALAYAATVLADGAGGSFPK